MKKLLATVVTAGLLATTLSACSGGTTAPSADPKAPLKVGASPVPHAEILTFVKDNLAKDAGLDLQIVEFTDYVQPNQALADKSIDANYFQHKPYLDAQIAQRGYSFVAATPVHLEPLGIYSTKVTNLDALADGAKVAIPNDPSNGGRSLKLLASKNLLTLKDTGDKAPTVADIAGNPKHLKISELEAAQLPRSLGDVDAAVINGNYAIPAKLDPAKDALALEDATGNPYANLLVTRKDDADDPRVKKLAELLCSAKTADFITEKYHGAVVAACK